MMQCFRTSKPGVDGNPLTSAPTPTDLLRQPVRICEEEPKLSTAVSKEFENDEVDQIDDGKVNICDNDSALLSLVDHDAMKRMPTTAELKKGSVKPEREV
ncbi:unnamed protein product [Trichobilharzia regenti]|nr:unnamed protein product [Trichobilharzia regenti]